MTKNYFQDKKPTILLTSYSTYIQHGIAVRVAVRFNTRVYSFGNNQSLGKNLTKDELYHTQDYKNYKEDFEIFTNKDDLLRQSQIALEQRLSGKIDLATSYMKESAYSVSNIEVPDLKNHVVIFLHDFFDSPHIYGDMIFLDFLEWIEFTISVLDEYNIPYCLKPHPNQILDSKSVVEELKIKYPHIKLISPKITNKQLVAAGIKVGVSVYGTVAHELTYMGIPVILSAKNPHSSYDFCYEATNKEQFTEYLKSYESLKVSNDSKYEIESFYYMHNLNHNEKMKELLVKINLLRRITLNHDDRVELKEFINELSDILSNEEFVKFVYEL